MTGDSDHAYGTSMTDDEIEAVLYEHGTATLSLSQDGEAYGIPVSYGYDGDRDRCLLDLGFGPESRKRSFIETTDRGCLTVYEWDSPTEWRSVVVQGSVRKLDEELDDGLEELYYEHATDVAISVFDRPPETIELQWYEFAIDEFSGRASANSDAAE